MGNMVSRPPITDPVYLSRIELDWLKILIETEDVHRFYGWHKWLKERDHVWRNDQRECQKCKLRGRYSRATLVHHVVHLRHAPQLALSMWRLEGGVWVRQLLSLCDSCHDDEHPERLVKWTAKPQLTVERWD